MNAYAPVPGFIDVNMTSKGQVLIPKAIRDRAGLVPGAAVAVGINELDQVIVVSAQEARRRRETPAQREARVRAAIASVAGKYDFGGGTTDEIMQGLRGDRNA